MHKYRVAAIESGKEYILHDAFSDEEQIYDDELSEELGKVPSFTFCMARTHPFIGYIEPLSTRIFIYDNGEEIFDGRVISDKRDIVNTGTITVAGGLSYLSDSQQEPAAYTGGITAFIDMVLARHNAQNNMQFIRGNVTVKDSNDYINRSWSDYTDTLSLLNAKLVDTHGGYLAARHIKENQYELDYLLTDGLNDQVVRLGENILDLASEVNSGEIITRLIPLGAVVQSDQETEIKKYVTIDTVNGMKNYIEREDLISRYGIIVGVKQWENVTLPENLLTKAKAFINSVDLPKTFNIKVLDLSVIDEVQSFDLGKETRVISKGHDLDARYVLSKRTRHLTAPQNDSITLGAIQATITQSQLSSERKTSEAIAQTAIDASNNIINTGMTITGAKGGYVILDTYDDNGKLVAPWQLLIMDTPNKSEATNVIRMNQNGIGFSTSGYNGPYENAWTIDGRLNANFIRTGSLILGGSTWNTDGAIEVLDSNNVKIGSWDKTGLTVLKGIIQGVSAIFGGSGNENGAIEIRDGSGNIMGRWDKDGIVSYSGNKIIFETDSGSVNFGDFWISSQNTGIFESKNGGFRVEADGGTASVHVGDYETGSVIGEDEIRSYRMIVENTSEWGGAGYNGDIGTILDAIWTGHSWSLDNIVSRLEDLEAGQGEREGG